MRNVGVSLVIRTLNEEEDIFRCLACVASQTVLPNEVIIVDNNSTDATLAIVERFKEILPLRVILNPVYGYASGLNLGAQNAKEEIIGFLSADCFPEKDWLKKLLDLMQENNCDVVIGTEIMEGENDVHYVINKTARREIKDRKCRYFYNSNILYRKHTLERFLPFRGLGIDQGSEDIMLSIEYTQAGLSVMKSASALVWHKMYDCLDAFRMKKYYHGQVALLFFRKYPTYPRTYLSPFYWVCVEYIYFLMSRNPKFLRVANARLVNTVRGILWPPQSQSRI